jgi:hypothetical protein
LGIFYDAINHGVIAPRNQAAFFAGPSLFVALASIPEHTEAFLLENLVNFSLGKDGIFLLAEVHETVRADI